MTTDFYTEGHDNHFESQFQNLFLSGSKRECVFIFGGVGKLWQGWGIQGLKTKLLETTKLRVCRRCCCRMVGVCVWV